MCISNMIMWKSLPYSRVPRKWELHWLDFQLFEKRDCVMFIFVFPVSGRGPGTVQLHRIKQLINNMLVLQRMWGSLQEIYTRKSQSINLNLFQQEHKLGKAIKILPADHQLLRVILIGLHICPWALWYPKQNEQGHFC